jgi:uncharacterized delta-60 repeat protein
MAILGVGISGRLEEGETLKEWVLGTVTGLQWQALVNGIWVNVGAANSQTYVIPAGAAGTAYRLAATDGFTTTYSTVTGPAIVDTKKVNAPYLTGPDLAGIGTEDPGARPFFQWLTFSDADKGNYGGGSLLVQDSTSRIYGGDGQDVLGIHFAGTNAGQFSYNAATHEVRYAFTTGTPTVIGMIDSVLNGNGTDLKVVFNANATTAAVAALVDNLQFTNADDSPTLSRLLTIKVTDPTGASAQRVTSVSIENAPDAPVFTNSASATVNENQTAALTITANDPDREAGQPQGISYSLASGDGDHDNGAFLLDAASGALSFRSAPDYEDPLHGPQYTVRVRATDSDGSVTDQVIAIAVRNVNEAPVAFGAATFAAEDGAPVTLNALYGDQDANDPHTFTLDTAATLGRVTMSGQTFTYDPAGRFEQLPGWAVATDTFKYTVTDAAGLSSTATMTVLVQGQNDPATITGPSSAALVEDTGVSFDGMLHAAGKLVIADIDSGEAQILPGIVSGGVGSFTILPDGNWQYSVADSAVQYLGAGQTVVDSVTVTSWDRSAIQNLQVTITGTNDAPVIDASSDFGGVVQVPAGASGVLTTGLSSQYSQPLLEADAAGRLLAFGAPQDSQGLATQVLERYLADGSLDPAFGFGGKATLPIPMTPHDMTVDGSGRTLVVGYNADHYSQSRVDWALCRVNADGSADTSFGNAGSVTLDFLGGYDYAQHVAVDPAGHIVVTGTAGNPADGSTEAAIARFNADGSPDSSFGNGGVLVFNEGDGMRNVTTDGQGRFLVWGNAIDPSTQQGSFCVARFLADGSRDKSFGTGGHAYVAQGTVEGVQQLAVAGDGSVVLGWGEFSGYGSGDAVQLVRLNAQGQLDTGFGSGGRLATTLSEHHDLELAIDAQGRVLAAIDDMAGNLEVARFNADGSMDPGFAASGRMNVDLGGDDELAALQLLADGRIQLSGSAWTGSGGDAAVARLNADGTVDHSFGQVSQAVVSVSGDLFGSDPDRGDTLVWSGGSADAYGRLQVTPAGDWTYTLDTSSAATRALASGVTATEHFTATLTDGAGATATHDITITIVGTNDAPAG